MYEGAESRDGQPGIRRMARMIANPRDDGKVF
jgi:hypothetical protein